jgi:plasmid maintenance system killer protein
VPQFVPAAEPEDRAAGELGESMSDHAGDSGSAFAVVRPPEGWSGGAFQRQGLVAINTVDSLGELAVPSENRLERLRGDRAGEHSIRINQQYRICFRWEDGHALEVEFVDYHERYGCRRAR